jgi:hypothetical protein
MYRFACALRREVHDDCYRLVSYYIEETAGADIKARMLDFYLRLVEPFFGLPERQHLTVAHKGEHQHHEVAPDTDSDEEGDKPGERACTWWPCTCWADTLILRLLFVCRLCMPGTLVHWLLCRLNWSPHGC